MSYEEYKKIVYICRYHKSWWCVGILPKDRFYNKNLKLLTWPIKVMMDSGKNWDV